MIDSSLLLLSFLIFITKAGNGLIYLESNIRSHMDVAGLYPFTNPN